MMFILELLHVADFPATVLASPGVGERVAAMPAAEKAGQLRRRGCAPLRPRLELDGLQPGRFSIRL